MVKATRRVKRSKKQVHHGRRKTSRRCRRYTRRQRGGAIITVCEKKYAGLFKTESNASGIDITYDDENHMFKIGTPDYVTVDQLKTFNGADRYNRAVSVLDRMEETSTQLNWHNFARFANMYCRNAADPQCAQITGFVNDYKVNKKGDDEDKNAFLVGRTIKGSIDSGETGNKHSDAGFKETNFGAAAVAADDSSTCQEHLQKKGVLNSLILTKKPSCIAYINHANFKELQTLTENPEYMFKNFTIPLYDAVITGTLTINFIDNSFELILDLNGRENTNTPAFIDCMTGLDQCGTVTVTAVQRTDAFVSKDKLTVKGTVALQRQGEMIVYNFQTFVTKFAEEYKFCTTLLGQNLENAEELNRLDAGALVKLIKGRTNVLDKQMPEYAEYKNLKSEFEKFIKPYKDKRIRIENTKYNLSVLNDIYDRLKVMKLPTSAELSDKLGSLLD